MLDVIDEEQTMKNRIILRENTLRKLTSKYIDLLSKFNTLTRNEMAQLIKEILNEIDMIEISILKAENLEKLKEIDTVYQRSLALDTDKKVKEINNEIVEYSKKLVEAKNEKEYKIYCEEVAKIINSYNSKQKLQGEIFSLEDEIKKIKSTDDCIMDKLGTQSKRLSLLVKLVGDLRMKFEDDGDNGNNGPSSGHGGGHSKMEID